MSDLSSKQHCTHPVFGPSDGIMQADTVAGCVQCTIEQLRSENTKLWGRLDAAEQHVKILQAQKEALKGFPGETSACLICGCLAPDHHDSCAALEHALKADGKRLDFLEQWVKQAKARGMVWDTFTFDTGRDVRDQLDEQMKAGFTELEKSRKPEKTEASHEYPICKTHGGCAFFPSCACGHARKTEARQAPIACIRIGEDDSMEVAHLYAPGLPPGHHDLYCAPPVSISKQRELADRVFQLFDGSNYGTLEELQDALRDWHHELLEDLPAENGKGDV